MVADVDTFADGLLMGFTQLFSGVLTILGTLLFMLRQNVPITLVVVLHHPPEPRGGQLHRQAHAMATSRARAPSAASRPPSSTR